jgi:hypothetical protein
MGKVTGSDPKSTLYCSFCGKSQHEVRKLIAGPTVFICDECVELCKDIIREETKSAPVKSRDGIPTPKEIREGSRRLRDWPGISSAPSAASSISTKSTKSAANPRTPRSLATCRGEGVQQALLKMIEGDHRLSASAGRSQAPSAGVPAGRHRQHPIHLWRRLRRQNKTGHSVSMRAGARIDSSLTAPQRDAHGAGR